jgi:hypothetical protein
VEVATAGGVGSLVALHRVLKAAGARLILRNVTGALHEVFAATRLIGLLDVRPA